MAVESINEAKVGDYILFGKYEQDNNYRNGREDLEWLVLAKEDNKILVISKYGLEFKRFHDITSREMRKIPGGITWEKCSLRKFLNEEFINNAFSTAEQNQIISTTVTADVNDRGLSPGNDTTDKIFLLSVNEANKYFSDDSARRCKCTTYCYAQNIYREVQEEDCDECDDDIYEACCAGKINGCDRADEAGGWGWWLRTRGDFLHLTAYVVSNGAVSSYGHDTDYYGVVRPAMWISLEPLYDVRKY